MSIHLNVQMEDEFILDYSIIHHTYNTDDFFPRAFLVTYKGYVDKNFLYKYFNQYYEDRIVFIRAVHEPKNKVYDYNHTHLIMRFSRSFRRSHIYKFIITDEKVTRLDKTLTLKDIVKGEDINNKRLYPEIRNAFCNFKRKYNDLLAYLSRYDVECEDLKPILVTRK